MLAFPPQYPEIITVCTGRRVPQSGKKSLFIVTGNEEGNCLRVQETISSGRIIATIDYARADPELSVTRAIADFRLRVNHWSQRK